MAGVQATTLAKFRKNAELVKSKLSLGPQIAAGFGRSEFVYTVVTVKSPY